MNPETPEFLNAYVAELVGLENWTDVHTHLADWNFDHTARHALTPVLADINNCLNLAGDDNQFRDHVLTTLVGQPANGLLFVSANPGWNNDANAVEAEFRAVRGNNQRFGADFFNVFPALGLNSRWWARALLLAYLVETGAQNAITVPARWTWAQAGAAVGNLDLLPFHSIGDRFGLLGGQGAAAALRNVAVSTLQMALRLQPSPRLTLVASALGAPIADSLCMELGMEHVPGPTDALAPFHRLHRYVHPETGVRVMTFPYQVFAGNAAIYLPAGFMLPLATHMRMFGEF